MMYFYMYLQSVVPESCLSGTIVKYIICLFYLSDCFQTKACCQTYILFCEFSCISHANNRFCNICLYSLLHSFSYQFFRFQFQNFSTHSFLQSFLCFLRSSKNNPLLSKKSFYKIHYKCSSSFIFCTCSRDVCVSSAIASKDRSPFFNR